MTPARLFDLQIKGSLVQETPLLSPRVGEGQLLRFQYDSLFDLGRRERNSPEKDASTFEFVFAPPVDLLALPGDWLLRVGLKAQHSVTGLGVVAKRNYWKGDCLVEGRYGPGTALQVNRSSPGGA